MGGKKLSQHDLRKAMLDQKNKSGMVKRIDSPLAKYTESGQLMCVICKSLVRSETIWKVHLSSRSHKENLLSAKESLTTKEPSKAPAKPAQAFKRPISPPRASEPPAKIRGILKNCEPPSGLPPDFFDNKTGSNNPSPTPPPEIVSAVARKTEQLAITPQKNVGNARTDGDNAEVNEAESNTPAALPEGFFDDPILDAKVRNVEYKDPIEEEWEKFQREMREEAAQSAQIIAEDQEEATTERQLDEIDEQMRNYSKVMDLVRRKDEVKAAEKKKDVVDEDMSSGDETEYDEFLDWRAKTSYK